MTSSTIDEVRDVPESLASTVGDAAEILGEVAGGRLIERRRRVDPATTIPPALPLPESYKALPASFTELFTLEEKVRMLKTRRHAWKTFLSGLDSNDPDRRYYERRHDAAAANVDAVDFEKIAKLQFSVSNLTIRATSDANEVRAELAGLAFDAFSLRAHGLGLETWQLERAFNGSARYLRFVRPALGLTSLRQAFIGSQMYPYIDLKLSQIVYDYERAVKAKAEFEAMRTEVRKKLSAAKKTFGKELVAA